MDSKTCYYVYRGANLMQRLGESRYTVVRAFAALGIQFLMGFSFALVCKKGAEYNNGE